MGQLYDRPYRWFSATVSTSGSWTNRNGGAIEFDGVNDYISFQFS